MLYIYKKKRFQSAQQISAISTLDEKYLEDEKDPVNLLQWIMQRRANHVKNLLEIKALAENVKENNFLRFAAHDSKGKRLFRPEEEKTRSILLFLERRRRRNSSLVSNQSWFFWLCAQSDFCFLIRILHCRVIWIISVNRWKPKICCEYYLLACVWLCLFWLKTLKNNLS